jgi:hypothetical protein
MNSKRVKLIEIIMLKARILKKMFIISKEMKKRGGNAGRSEQRSHRRASIIQEKIKMRDDLVRSWGLGEIPPPTDEEQMKFYLYYHNLPWDYIIATKRKYWNMNI